MHKIDVTSIEIRDYATSLGWKLVKEALKDGLYVLNSPTGDYTQLMLLKDDEASDFQNMAFDAIARLSEFYRLPFNKIAEDIREVNDDVLSLRYYSDSKAINSISFEEAIESIEATKQLLLAAASTVVKPALFHPKLNRTEPKELLKQNRFRHTEEGSFILKISCPFQLSGRQQNSFFPQELEKPFSRKVFETVNLSSVSLSDAIESDSINELFNNQSDSQIPIISYNFCEALTNLFDKERELPFQLIFNWSRASLSKIKAPVLINKVSFPFSQKAKMEEIKEYFTPHLKDISGTFYGSVETLDGDIGEDGKRAGFVVLSVLYENELLKAKVYLPPQYYSIAVDAHKIGGVTIAISGNLIRSKRNNRIDNPVDFKQL